MGPEGPLPAHLGQESLGRSHPSESSVSSLLKRRKSHLICIPRGVV